MRMLVLVLARLRMRMRMRMRMFSSKCRVFVCSPDGRIGVDLEPGGGFVTPNVGQQMLKSLGA